MGWGGDDTTSRQQELRTNAALSNIRTASRTLANAVEKWRKDRTTANEEEVIAAHDAYKKAQVDAVTQRGLNGW